MPNFKVSIKVTSTTEFSDSMVANRTVNAGNMPQIFRPFYDLLQEADHAFYPPLTELPVDENPPDAKS